MGQVKLPFFRFLDTNGDGTGTKDANGNYASAEEIFYLQPAAGEIMLVHRMLVMVEDGNGMLADEYGKIGQLSNGVQVRVQNDSGTIIDLTDGKPITENAEWGRFCYDVKIEDYGSGDDILLARWTFAASGSPLRLEGSKNERLEIVLNDDLSGLDEHSFMVQGVYETKEF